MNTEQTIPSARLRIVVLIKQVPDTTAISRRAMKADGTLNRSALPAIFNPEDLSALELALRVREQMGGSICAMTMGPPAAAEILRESLYRGVDRAVLLTDKAFAGSDTLATSYVLSCAIKTIGGADLILCGRQAIDGNTAQVGPQVAEKLGINQLTYVERIEALTEQEITVWREIEQGRELATSRLPVLLTVVPTAARVRPPSVRLIMKYKKARAPAELHDPSRAEALDRRGLLIEEWNAARIGADPSRCGLAGSPTRVKKIQSVVLTGAGLKRFSADAAGVRSLLEELIATYAFD
ncbi:MAG: electron transfer flavoprotein subunit beta/FixA family protein [Desulfobacterota bacterium]|nr:electron transfer flavoprotein subunit beta/FixA family protein [Thermodesulfobacteriota bacterium]